MGIVSQMDVGLIAGVVTAVALSAAFFAYMIVFGRKSSLRQKDVSKTEEARQS